MAADMDAVDARVRKAEAQGGSFGLDASAILPDPVAKNSNLCGDPD
jgi:hypothetical protein